MPLLRKIAFLVLRRPRERRHAIFLVLAMVVAAGFEAMGVGLIMPFVALIQNPRIVEVSRTMRFVRDLTGAETEIGFIYTFGMALVSIFVIKNAFLSFVQWLQFRFIFDRQVALSREVVGRYLGSPYTFHLQHNSAELIQSVMLEIHLIANHVLVSLFTIAVEMLTVIVILGAMVAVEPLLVPLVGLSIAVVAFAFYRAVQKKSLALGETEKAHQAQMIKWLQQGLGGIKEASVIGVERFFLDSFHRAASGLGRSEAQHRLITLLPRYLLESLGMIALVTISLGMIARGRGSAAVLPVLGVLAVAAVRLLPSVSRVLACLTDLRHNTPPVDAIYRVLTTSEDARELPEKGPTPLGFERDLRMTNVEYRYPGAAQPSLREVSLTIRRGESIAIVGGSGAGKTTMSDVLIGLLEPTAGTIEVDGKPLKGERLLAWRKCIGYIPQQVYLCDDSVLRNVAFGVEDAMIDRSRVEGAIEAARLRELVDGMPDGLDTFVGERGVRISGGQRQRIGIARALYLEPEVLVLDEATSSLDGKTEHEIVEAIERIRSDRTAIIIAHRLSTVRSCERLVFMKEGRVVQVGSWDELYAENADFRHLLQLAERDDRTNGSAGASTDTALP